MAQGKVFAEHGVHFFVTACSTSCPPSSSSCVHPSRACERTQRTSHHQAVLSFHCDGKPGPALRLPIMYVQNAMLCTVSSHNQSPSDTLFPPVRYPVSISPYVQAWGQSGSRSDGGRTMDASLAMSNRDICFSHALVLRPHARVPSPFPGP